MRGIIRRRRARSPTDEFVTILVRRSILVTSSSRLIFAPFARANSLNLGEDHSRAAAQAWDGHALASTALVMLHRLHCVTAFEFFIAQGRLM